MLLQVAPANALGLESVDILPQLQQIQVSEVGWECSCAPDLPQMQVHSANGGFPLLDHSAAF